MNDLESRGTITDRLLAIAVSPIFLVLVLISPLVKPRGRVIAPRYTYLDGRMCKTFLVDDNPQPQRSRQARDVSSPKADALPVS